MRSLFRKLPYHLHHVWLVAAVLAVRELWLLADLASLSRTSIAANQRSLDIIKGSTSAAQLAIAPMLFSLLLWRRRLKRDVIKRLGPRWQRVAFGLLMPIAAPFYWMRDIERLAKARRGSNITKQSLRMWQPKKSTFLWLVLVFLWTQVSSPLDTAALGITYVTEGTSAIDDPLRYALKWIDPLKITDALDEYSKYIWIGCVANCAAIATWSVSTWVELNRLARLTKNALS